jgi:hypothetical protein
MKYKVVDNLGYFVISPTNTKQIKYVSLTKHSSLSLTKKVLYTLTPWLCYKTFYERN